MITLYLIFLSDPFRVLYKEIKILSGQSLLYWLISGISSPVKNDNSQKKIVNVQLILGVTRYSKWTSVTLVDNVRKFDFMPRQYNLLSSFISTYIPTGHHPPRYDGPRTCTQSGNPIPRACHFTAQLASLRTTDTPTRVVRPWWLTSPNGTTQAYVCACVRTFTYKTALHSTHTCNLLTNSFKRPPRGYRFADFHWP